MQIPAPYALYLGDIKDMLSAKTAQGVADWRPEQCVGEVALPAARVSVGLERISLQEAVNRGAKTLIVGGANAGGMLPPSWIASLEEALSLGLNLASGLHERLVDIPSLADRAQAKGLQLFDVRHPTGSLHVGQGYKRQGKRLLTVGTDCSVGKMYTSLALEKEMQAQGFEADFRATGQTGILICGSGISVDAVVSDFISGAVEALAPAHENPEHWDIIEGQGSLFHPSFAGVTMGLIHGSQPDAIVVCHEPTREHMRGLPGRDLPDLGDCMARCLEAARLTNPDVTCIGFAINTVHLFPAEANTVCTNIAQRFGLPVVDPVRHGVKSLVAELKQAFEL